MSNVEYDLDTSGGLMPQVQALIAPPTSEDNSKGKKQDKSEHPYFKRPGRGHNRDICDACAEGGDLICCDKCPASFHLTCHDPPLEEKDIPAGQWLCHHCRKTKELATEKTPQVRNKRSNSSTCSNVSNNSSTTSSTKKLKINPMNVLVKAASLLNPKQFELPRNMSTPCLFPGTDKVENLYLTGRHGKHRYGAGTSSWTSSWGSASSSSSAKNNKHKSTELVGGLVPLPARTCFECRRSCRIAPLVSCDYCPLLFHMDCLDPPLTALPAGRWMCPNHVEQYIDSKLVTSVSATERIRLWDKFSGPVDQDAIKTQFIRKVHCKNPPFRVKVRLNGRKRASIPGMVRQHYKNPVPLLPSLKDVLRLETVANRGREYLEYITALYVSAAATNKTQRSTEESMPSKVKNGMLPQMLYNGEEEVIAADEDLALIENLGENKIEIDETFNGEVSEDMKLEIEEEPEMKVKLEPDLEDAADVNSNNNGAYNGNAAVAMEPETMYESSVNSRRRLPDFVGGPLLHADIERELKQLDDRLVRLLAYQRVQHLLNSQQLQQYDGASNVPFLAAGETPENRTMPLPSELLTAADIDRISRVFTSPKRQRPRPRAGGLRARAMLCPVVSKHFYNVRTSEVDPSQVRHDASFMGFRPTVSARFPEAAAMRYRALTIGRGSANDVELDRFGFCNYTSPKHAVIFYDECTKHYELINYSEYGTQVNNVLYSCDFSDKNGCRTPKPTAEEQQQPNSKVAAGRGGTTQSAKAEEQKGLNLMATVREIVDKKRKVQRRTRDGLLEARMTAVADGCENLECQCGGQPPSLAQATSESDGSGVGGSATASAGWEGAAVLGHGALLRFGCITFVFSIVECATL